MFNSEFLEFQKTLWEKLSSRFLELYKHNFTFLVSCFAFIYSCECDSNKLEVSLDHFDFIVF